MTTTVEQLIRAGACSSGCIAAVTPAYRCQCPCKGRLHGLLTPIGVDALLTPRTDKT